MNSAEATRLQARRLLRAEHTGLLSTFSKHLGGYPFGTAVSYLTDHQARPFFLISQLAEHTRNIEQDARVSLLAYEQTADVQAGERLTVVGKAARLDTTEALKARYLRYFPQAEEYFSLDFGFYSIEPVALRYIGGPGMARWISPGDVLPPANSLAEEESALLSRLNREKAGDLLYLCRTYYGMSASTAVMAGVDCDGCDIQADGTLLRFDFQEVVSDGVQAEAALSRLLQSNP